MNRVVLLSFLAPLISAHICMIWPNQRGGWTPGGLPGDDKCFQPKAPCGTVAPSSPTVTFTGGTTYYVTVQQNLNHYNPGFPGFIDIGYAVGPNHNSDDDFTVLAKIPDYWSHLQASQTNFSIPVVFPNINCTWCTLRVRYHPNKPTEPIFHQCSDIAITTNSNVKYFDRKVFGFVQYSRHDFEGYLAEVSSEGKLTPLPLSINIYKRNTDEVAANDQFVASGLVAPTFDDVQNEIFFIGDSLANFQKGNAANILYRYNLENQKLSFVRQLTRTGQQWSALLRTDGGFIGVQHGPQGNGYSFTVSAITPSGIVQDIGSTPSNNTFVNFFWAQIDPTTNSVYILSGDENSLYDLNVVLYKVSLSTGKSSFVVVDNSAFTISNFHVDPNTGNLYSVSPGLFGESSWTLVTINPSNGAVTPKAKIPNSSKWVFDFGGGVYNGLSSDGKRLLQTFRWGVSRATALAVIDVASGNILYLTDLNRNTNNDRHVTGLIAL